MQAPWPDGVTARYLTVGGATVDLTDDDGTTRLLCAGCGHGKNAAYYPPAAHRKAQAHAERCRALPRPAAGQ
ncbi:hypothetical protein EF919_18240 [Streptomyces sp. WAC02707]|uniref:hypothetical protein n=1 Tax=Streptomyces TaxID=1883 RepID=UPI000F76F69F|nr:hypothetical protein [Streptomyces sp. WAC02707]RSS92474.1 hypothetical protein EF919_18240 [Streptomyces sp. WAC02707]